MLKENAKKYYIGQNKNCAEAILMAANDVYALGAGEDTIKALGVFGGGIGVGSICGAAAGATAALGLKYSTGDAHTSPEMKEKCKAFMEDFFAEYDTELCKVISPKHKTKETRCLAVVEKAAELLEKNIAN